MLARAAGVALAAVALASCGVPLQDRAEPLPAGALPTAQAQISTVPKVERTDIYFVSGRFLEPIPEALPAPTPQEVLAALAVVPDPQSEDGLRTLLIGPSSGEPMFVVASATDDLVVLRSTNEYVLMPATDQALLVGQVVHSMSAIGVRSVAITDETGAPLAVARPDGLSLEEPATPRDYESLLRR
jgi:hypothetical protein